MQRATKFEHAGYWPAEAAVGTVTLDYDDRHRRRMRLKIDNGMVFLLDLKRAALLKAGDGLALEDGTWVAVVASDEDVIDVHVATYQATARLAWHLGNRHLPVQILEDGGIRFRYDHVIEEMVQGLGGRTARKMATFTPEGGAYSNNGHDHGHVHHDHYHHGHSHE